MEDKEIIERFEKIEERLKKLESKKINDTAGGLPALTDGAIDTGSASTDVIIESMITRYEKLITNIQGA